MRPSALKTSFFAEIYTSGVRLALMQHQFAEYEDEPQTESSSGRSGGPPPKHTGVGVLDPPVPPKRPVPPLEKPASPWLIRGFAILILAVLALMLFAVVALKF
jgi:hypothetical protein